jgi:hypothetical protein
MMGAEGFCCAMLLNVPAVRLNQTNKSIDPVFLQMLMREAP